VCGGPDGELGASMRYLSQRYAMPYPEIKALLTDIGTEELVPVNYRRISTPSAPLCVERLDLVFSRTTSSPAPFRTQKHLINRDAVSRLAAIHHAAAFIFQ